MFQYKHVMIFVCSAHAVAQIHFSRFSTSKECRGWRRCSRAANLANVDAPVHRVTSSHRPIRLILYALTNPVRLLYKHIDNKLPAQICGKIECPEINLNIGIQYEGSQSGEVHKETRLVFFGA